MSLSFYRAHSAGAPRPYVAQEHTPSCDTPVLASNALSYQLAVPPPLATLTRSSDRALQGLAQPDTTALRLAPRVPISATNGIPADSVLSLQPYVARLSQRMALGSLYGLANVSMVNTSSPAPTLSARPAVLQDFHLYVRDFSGVQFCYGKSNQGCIGISRGLSGSLGNPQDAIPTVGFRLLR